MLRVTPIYGSQWEERGPSPLGRSTLIEYGGVKVLFNVGYNGSSSIKYPDHDVLVITDGGLESMGGLPVYYRQQQQKQSAASENPNDTTHPNDNNTTTTTSNKSTTPSTNSSPPPMMYATFPTVKMGQMMLYDHHASMCMDGMMRPYTLEELDASTAALQTMKYSQTLRIRDQLQITAHRSGHAVGGAFYVFRRIQDDTVVVVTSPNYHVARELHLDSSSLLQYGATPDVLITAPGGPSMSYLSSVYYTGMKQMQPVVTQAETNLVDTVMAVLRRDGNVLIPCDASGRVLELLLVLHQQWERQRLSQTYHLIWLGPMVHNTLEFARCQLEWMAIRLGQQFDSLKGHPYALPLLTLCTSVTEMETHLAENPDTPSCVLASGLSLDHGCARNLFLQWAENPDNAILLTDSSQASLRTDFGCGIDQLKNMNTTTTTTMNHPGSGGVGGGSSSSMQERTTSSSSILDLEGGGVGGGGAVGVVVEEDDEVDPTNMMSGTKGNFTTELSEWTTSAQLLRHWVKAKVEGREMEDVIECNVLVPRQVPLKGKELQQFLNKEERRLRQSQLEQEEQAMLQQVELAKGQLRLDEQYHQDSTTTSGTTISGEQQQQYHQDMQYNYTTTTTNNNSSSPSKRSMTTTTSSFMQRNNKKKKSRFDSNLFIKFSKPLHLSFEFREEAVGIGQSDNVAKYGIGESIGNSSNAATAALEDEYGIAVEADFFQDIVTGVDPSKFQQSTIGGGGGGTIDHHSKKKNMMMMMMNNKELLPEGGDVAVLDGDNNTLMTRTMLEAQDLSEGYGIIRGRQGRPPMKVSLVPRTVEVLCEIHYIPLEGRGDARASRQTIRALQPRQVVILGGDSHNTNIVVKKKKNDEEEDIIKNEVALLAQSLKCPHEAPSDGQTAELNVGHAAYSVRLIDTPLLTTQQEEEPVVVRSLLEQTLGACTVSRFDFVGTGKKVALEDSIVLAPYSTTTSMEHAKNKNHNNNNNNKAILVSDGDVLLTDLRAELTAQGFKAEYSSGKIVVNGKIMVEKKAISSSSSSSSEDHQHQELQVEGPLCEDFYTVRSLVCGQFVTL